MAFISFELPNGNVLDIEYTEQILVKIRAAYDIPLTDAVDPKLIRQYFIDEVRLAVEREHS